MLITVLFLNTLLLFLLTGSLNATTYYVDNSGNDGNSGTSQSTAWNSLSKVNSFGFNSGDIVSFKCGQRFSGTTISGKSNITFNSYGSGARPVIDGQGARNCFSLDNQTNIIFNGLKIVNGGGGDISQNIGLWNTTHVIVESCNIDSSRGANIHNVGIYAGGGSSYLTVRNSTLSFGEQTSGAGNLGIYIDACDNTLMEYDTLDGNFSGIRVAMGGSVLDTSRHDVNYTDNLIVRYCVIKNNKWDGIDDDGSYNAMYYYNLFINNNIEVYQFTNGDSNYQIFSAMYAHYYNNTFVHSGNGGMFEYTPPSDITGQVVSTGLTCKNNIFYNTGSNMMYHPWGTPAKKFTFNNNIWYGSSYQWDCNNTTTTSFSTWQGWGYDANGAAVNPQFTNLAAGDYSLQTGSPGLNSGTNVGLTVDIHGNSVPLSSPDMGALQHGSGGGGGGGGTIPPSTLNLTALIEALYTAGGTAMTISPMVTVELHSSTSPYALVDSNSALLNPAGTGTFKFTKAVNGTGYYIVVKYMNALATWSASPQSFTSSALSYNFTTAVTQAYTDGSNLPLALHNGKYCLYSGDLNQDGVVNRSDYTGVDSDNSTFNFHSVNDLNGDGLISSADEQFIDNNFIKSIHRQAPAGAL